MATMIEVKQKILNKIDKMVEGIGVDGSNLNADKEKALTISILVKLYVELKSAYELIDDDEEDSDDIDVDSPEDTDADVGGDDKDGADTD